MASVVGGGRSLRPQSLPGLSARPRAKSGAPAAAEEPGSQRPQPREWGPPRCAGRSSPGGRHTRATPGQGTLRQGPVRPRPGGSAQAEAAPGGPAGQARARGRRALPESPHGGGSCVCS